MYFPKLGSRAEGKVPATHPHKKQPLKGKGMVWVCDLTLTWSETIYCNKTAAAKQAAHEKREKAKRESEEKAKKEGK